MGVEVPTQADFAQLETYSQALEARIVALEAGGGSGGGTPSNGGGWSPYVDARDHGLSESSPDNSIALNAAIDAAWATKFRRVMLPVGKFRCSSPIYGSGVIIEGAGRMTASELIMTQAGGNLIHLTGQRADAPGGYAQGGRLARVALLADQDIVAGSAVVATSDATYAPDGYEIEEVRITCTAPDLGHTAGLWQRAINLDGTARSSPPGIRGFTVRGVEVMQVAHYGVVVSGVTNFRGTSVRSFAGSGVPGGFWFGGNPANGTLCTDAQLTDCRMDGPLFISNCIDSGFEGRFYGGVTHHSSVDPARNPVTQD